MFKPVINNLKLYKNLYFPRSTPVLIYQMGKVGSSSIEKSLKKIHYSPYYHIHRLSPENIRAVQQEYLAKGLNYEQLQADKQALFIYNYLKQKKHPVKIISLVREPVSRNLSAYFQNFYRFTGEVFKQDQTYNIQKLIDTFIQEYNHAVPLEWFDKEFLPVLNVDVYSKPFDKQDGFVRFQDHEKDILILKCELPDTHKNELLRTFLDEKNFEIIRANISKEKEYSNVYQTFLDTIRLPEKYVTELYASRYTQHFYTSEDINVLTKKWLHQD